MKAAWQKQLGVDLQNSPGSWQSLWSPLAKIYIFFWEGNWKTMVENRRLVYPPYQFFLKHQLGAFLGVLQSAVACDSTRNLFLYKKSYWLKSRTPIKKNLSNLSRRDPLAPWLHPGFSPGSRKAAEARQNDLDRKLQQKDLDRERMRGGNWWDKKLLVFFPRNQGKQNIPWWKKKMCFSYRRCVPTSFEQLQNCQKSKRDNRGCVEKDGILSKRPKRHKMLL